MIARSLCAAAGCGAMLVFAAPAALAGEVCNQTSYVIEAAKAWRSGDGLASRGWTLLMPGECGEMDAPGDAQQFLYARTTMAYPDGVREWRGSQAACVDSGAFAFDGRDGCAAQGLQERGFRELSPDERRRATLVEPDEWNGDAADAGLQRLLRAAGYEINVIDAVIGGGTRRQIANFETEYGESFGEDRQALMRALHDAALERNSDAGLTVCNDAGAPIAAAVGSTRAAVDESRGWWRVEPGECAQVLGGYLREGDAFIYAKQLANPARPQPMTGGQAEFCIAPARFRAEGRSDCEGRGYEAAGFRPAPDIEDGSSSLVLTRVDFERPAAGDGAADVREGGR